MKKRVLSLVCASILGTNMIAFDGYCADKTDIKYICGDVNADGKFTVSDVVMLQKWLLGVPDVSLTNWKAADFCEDGELDVFDLCMMKRELITPTSSIERPLLTIENYDEYDKYVSDNSLSDKIVVYDKIKQYGKFKHFVVISDSRNEDYSQIMYALEDNSGYTINLTISKATKGLILDGESISPELIDFSDMSKTKKDNLSGYFTFNNKTYIYENGNLNSISWNDENNTFSVSGSSVLYDYPIESDTLISRMLKLEELQPPVERPLLTIESYDEYDKYISENSLSDKIVVYDKIKQYGKFKHFVVISDSRNEDYSQIMYALEDDSKYSTCLTINRVSKEELLQKNTISSDVINFSDMRTTKKDGITGNFNFNNRVYCYVNGKLFLISWSDDKNSYSLSGNSTLSDYPFETDTFTSHILKIV